MFKIPAGDLPETTQISNSRCQELGTTRFAQFLRSLWGEEDIINRLAEMKIKNKSTLIIMKCTLNLTLTLTPIVTLTLLYLDVVYVITDCGEVVLVVMVHEL